MANNPNPFADMFKSFGEFKAPSFDWDQVLSSVKQNVEACTLMNQMAGEGVQNLVRRQVQIAQSNAEEAIRLVKDLLASASSPETSMARQAEYVKSTVESALASSRELMDLAAKANVEAMDVLKKRAGAVMEEVSSLASAANANAGRAAAAQTRSKKDAA
jgi:phasin family protein